MNADKTFKIKLSVIIPAHNGGEHFKRCLESLAASTRAPDEIIIVDDASTDSSAALGSKFGARVLILKGPSHGPAFARNRGAEIATGDILIFFDADVAVHPDTVARIEKYFIPELKLAALFGSYDDSPPVRGWISRYKNLAHHYVHQHGGRKASTFWAGCGAIRREIFNAHRGFDETYENASIEDIELGTRLTQAGDQVWLCPEIQVTHLKRWAFFGLLRSDIFDRAIPWAQLILREGYLPSDLNLDTRSRLSAALVWIALIALGIGFVQAGAWVLALAAFATVLFLHRDFYTFLARRGGLFFAIGGGALHLLYFLYSTLVFASVIVWNRLKGLSEAIVAWTSSVTPRAALWLLLTLTLLKGMTWSLMIPPWHAPDENTHFLYAQMIRRDRTIHPSSSYWIPWEIGISWEASQMNRVRYHLDTWFDFSDREQIVSELARLKDPTAFYNALPPDPIGNRSFRNFTFVHPPFYYLVAAIPQALYQDSTIYVRVLADRWLSVVLGVITTALAFRAGQIIWQNDGWALFLATLVSFQPMLSFMMAVDNNQSMEIAIFSACLVLLLTIVREQLSTRRALLLGTLVGLGLLTRTSQFSILIPMGVVFLWDMFTRKTRLQNIGKQLLRWSLVLVLPVIIAGWWYSNWFPSPEALPSSASATNYLNPFAQSVPIDLFHYLWSYDWGNVYLAILPMYWGVFGWLDAPIPEPLPTLLSNLTIIALLSTSVYMLVRAFTDARSNPKKLFTIFFLGITGLSIIAFYTYVDYALIGDPIVHYGFQGRYYLPPIIAQMAWLAIGLVWLAPQHLRRAWMWLLAVGMVAVNLYALFGVITLRYYGARNLWLVADRAAVLQPLSANTILVLCISFLALTGAFLLSLLPAFKNASNAI